MNPGSNNIRELRHMLRSLHRNHDWLDDQTIACLLERGLEGLPADLQSRALTAIAEDPDIASILAHLDDPANDVEARRSALRLVSVWRLAHAACAALAVTGTWWMLQRAPASSGTPQLLDGSLPAPAATARGMDLLLLVIAWLLTLATFVPAFVLPRMAARHANRGGQPHVGE